jgi:hypothetical protein
MALAELGAAMWITRDGGAPVRDAAIAVLLLITLIAALAAMRFFDRRPAFLAPAHAAEVRAAARALADEAPGADGPRATVTSRGAGVAVSATEDGEAVVSLGMGEDAGDVEALCALAAAAFPEHAAETAHLTPGGRLLVAVPLPLTADAPPSVPGAAERLLGVAVRRFQARAQPGGEAETLPPPPRVDAGRDGYFGPRVVRPPAHAGR